LSTNPVYPESSVLVIFQAPPFETTMRPSLVAFATLGPLI